MAATAAGFTPKRYVNMTMLSRGPSSTVLIRLLAVLSVVLGFASAGEGQQLPAFDVVSVKPFDLMAALNLGNGTAFYVEPNRVHCYCRLSLMIENAYGVRPYLLSGPIWILDPQSHHVPEIYQLDARFPTGTDKKQIAAMMRRMLAERFHLSARIEMRDEPVYTLEVAPGGPKLQAKPSVVRDQHGILLPDVRPRMHIDLGTGVADFDGPMTMAKLAAVLSPDIDHDIIDKTGLDGEFEVAFCGHMPLRSVRPGMEFLQRIRDNSSPDGVPSIFAELQRLGLKLQPGRAQISHLIIDKADSIPTEN